MKRFIPLLFLVVFLNGCGFTNPEVPGNTVGLVTNHPFFIGDIGRIEGIIVGPGSFGLGWRNEVKRSVSYIPSTYNLEFLRTDKEDARILSKDKINIDAVVVVVLGFKNAPTSMHPEPEKFKANMRSYFTNYYKSWENSYQQSFKAYIRALLSAETYDSIMEKLPELNRHLSEQLDQQLLATPYEVVSLSIANINPPARLIDEQEHLKATQVRKQRQEMELQLQQSRGDVMKKEADNLAAAMKVAPRYLDYLSIKVREEYSGAMNTLITGDNAGKIAKVIFFPFESGNGNTNKVAITDQ